MFCTFLNEYFLAHSRPCRSIAAFTTSFTISYSQELQIFSHSINPPLSCRPFFLVWFSHCDLTNLPLSKFVLRSAYPSAIENFYCIWLIEILLSALHLFFVHMTSSLFFFFEGTRKRFLRDMLLNILSFWLAGQYISFSHFVH